MTLPRKEAMDIDVQSLTEVLVRKGFKEGEIQEHLEDYHLPIPDFTKIAAFKRTAQAIEDDIRPKLREAVQRLGHVPSIDEESWILTETSRALGIEGEELIAEVILEAGTSPDADKPPKGINPKAMGSWKKVFKNHQEEISDAKAAKQWGVAIAIFKNIAKKDGYEPFVEKAAWTMDSMSIPELASTVHTLTALAENLEMLGLDDLASEVDMVTYKFDSRLTEDELRLATSHEKERLSNMKLEIRVMPIDEFCRLVAQSLDAIKSRDFTRLFRKASKVLRKCEDQVMLHGVKGIYSLYAEVFDEDKALFAQAPPEALEEELFPLTLGFLNDAIMAIIDSVGGDEFYSPEENIPPINRVKLKNYLQSKYVEEEIYKILSRSPLWRQQFGL